MRVLQILEDSENYCKVKIAKLYADGSDGDCTKIQIREYYAEEKNLGDNGGYIQDITHYEYGPYILDQDQNTVYHYFSEGPLSQKVISQIEKKI